jgi:predicted DNA-binding ribbon-helix-helix protein
MTEYCEVEFIPADWTEALLEILSRGRKLTLAQLIELVAKKTGRTVRAASLNVCLSHLREEGHNVVTYHRSQTRDGVTRYVIE